ncbi:MAG: hypothetical protein ACKPA7_33540 [Sphaerospermopsis kisseleviana]
MVIGNWLILSKSPVPSDALSLSKCPQSPITNSEEMYAKYRRPL